MIANRAVTAILFIVGLINFAPVIGLMSTTQLETLYGVTNAGADLEILLRHRASMLGLLGAFLIFAAFRPELRRLACVAGLVSMLVFVALTFGVGGYGELLWRVAVIDIVASFGLVAALAMISTTESRSG